MAQINVGDLERRPDCWVASSAPDRRLSGFDDLGAALIDAFRFVHFGTIPEDEPDGDLIMPPSEMVYCLREAADVIERWTELTLDVT